MTKSLATLLAILVMVATASAQPLVGPDLAVTSITSTGTRVGIGETFTYTVTARNTGNAPCNWVNLTLQVPGEVDFVSATSSAPLTCTPVPLTRIIGLPFDVACAGGPGFFLWPGNTLTATFLVRARSTANDIRATAIADPGNVCFESNEANNKATTTSGTAIIRRPILKMTLNKPFPPVPGVGRSPGSQIFPVTITNIGGGPAFNVALSMSQSFVTPGDFVGPTIDFAYKGQLAASGQVPPGTITPDCITVPKNTTHIRTQTCLLILVLQPGEMLQLHYRATPLCGLAVPIALPDIHAGTPDDITQANHVVNLNNACAL